MLRQEDNSNTRLILAAVISTILIVFWGKFFKKDITPRVERKKEIEQLQLDKYSTDVVSEAVIEEDPSEEKLVFIDTKTLSGSINLRGLKFDNLILKNFKKDLNSDEKVQLLFPKNDNDSFFIDFGWYSNDPSIELPNATTLWRAGTETISANSPIVLFYINRQNIEFQLIVTIDDEYMFNFEQRVINNSDKTFQLGTQNKMFRREDRSNEKRTAGVHEGLIGSSKKQLEEVKFKKLKKTNFAFNGFDWAGFTDKYWLVSMVADARKSNLYDIKTQYSDGLFEIDFKETSDVVIPNQTTGSSIKIFAGPKALNLLDSYSKQYNIPLFDRAVDFGWFYFLTKPIYMVLKVFYNFVGNFGVAILLLTLLVKMIMYPFTKKSFISMAKMRKIQPKMEQLKEKYKNDKMGMNKELVELYKKENINPLSGCLPMLVQIPVFFSLYKVLAISIDMRQAPFFGYLKNLSEKDPTTVWNLFGLLPYDVKFLPIGLLPILMALTMWIQQKISGQTSMNKEAETTTKLMPFIFLIIFAGMPTGLLLYWTFSNVITIGQQLYIEYKINVKNKVVKMN